jgi:hypothetical protein
MSWFILKINTDNAAFECDGLQDEVSRILSVAARAVNTRDRYGKILQDINGNTVGEYYFTVDAQGFDSRRGGK